MPARSATEHLPLPRGWTKVVNAAVLQALSLAATVEDRRQLPIVELNPAAGARDQIGDRMSRRRTAQPRT